MHKIFPQTQEFRRFSLETFLPEGYFFPFKSSDTSAAICFGLLVYADFSDIFSSDEEKSKWPTIYVMFQNRFSF